MKAYSIEAVPATHEDLDKWRNNFTGIQYLHEPTNFLVFGAIDDLWKDSNGEYIVVDYKATSKNEKITELNQDWHKGYKRQMEIYQWLFRKNGFKVSNIGYFLYCNAETDVQIFGNKLEFDMTLIPYTGNMDWIEQTIKDAHKCLVSDTIPAAGKDCNYCAYRKSIDLCPK
jgi:CRISPR/Cas system-associated exonuclease Cas4 (RecB family)